MYRHAGRLALAAALALLLLPDAGAAKPRSSAWIPYWRQDVATRSVVAHRAQLASASPVWFFADREGGINSRPGADDPEVLGLLRDAGVRVIPTVTTQMRPDETLRVLGNDEARRAHIGELVELASRYAGLDLDYERPALTTDPATARRIRPVLNDFFSELCGALHARGRRCVITVMPRLGPRIRVWRERLIPWVYAYRRLGRVADRLRVMAYDQHAPGTAPGPIAGAPWVRKVARFAARHVRPAKVELGIPLYGRDWSRQTGESEGLTWERAQALRREVGGRRRWARSQRSSWFRYPGHAVWYSDHRSVRAAALIARRHDFAGAALWAPGYEDPLSWRVLRRALRSPR